MKLSQEGEIGIGIISSSRVSVIMHHHINSAVNKTVVQENKLIIL